MKISDFYNRHLGKRCFLLGSGPSLATMDLSGLRDEVTMSCNRGYLLFDKLGFHTTYWTIEDYLDAKQYSPELESIRSIKFVPEDLASFPGWGEYVPTPFVRGPFEYPEFSPIVPFMWGATVMHLMVQLAVYMGCGIVYLLGNDFRWKTDNLGQEVTGSDKFWITVDDENHFDSRYWPRGFRSFAPEVALMTRAFTAARVACERDGVKIINLTPNSALDVFERGDYAEVMA